MIKSFLVCIFSASALFSYASGDIDGNLVLPLEIAKKLDDCHQIDDFYSRYPDIRNPPYIYNIIGDEKDEFLGRGEEKNFGRGSFAAWCEGEPKGLMKYYLVFDFNGADKFGFSCSEKIGPFENAGGLVVDRITKEPLSWYFEVGSNDKILEEGITEGNILESSYDGMGYRFYCHKGRWLFRPIH
ncbi:hypothetical protein OQJ68_15455 [Microbulbifer thermotolerans]|uniref:WG containing repeat-containing protein n=1 Tax=Microbulbifer thermotolerans TaxID=252514 RepID=A0AB35I0S8_MICTH|nr:hypothetical protein [Microbulbifer thermotolerans]MCX2803190.1 hypothetical protein [Microbulbifer thermotolerans]